MLTDSYAYLVTAESPGATHVYVVGGSSMVAGARRAQVRIREMHGDQTRLIGIELLGPALRRTPRVDARGAGVPEDAAVPRSSTGEAPRAQRGTRTDQLLEVLHQRRGRAHLRDVARALDTNHANAQNVIAAGVKKGVVVSSA